MPVIILPPALVARLEEAAQAEGVSPSELVEGLLDRRDRDRGWAELVERGRQRGARALPPGASEDQVDDLVNARISEARRGRSGG